MVYFNGWRVAMKDSLICTALVLCIVQFIFIESTLCVFNAYAPWLKQQEKYLSGARLEYVRFFALSGSESDRYIERKAVVLRRPYARAVVLICHGFMCDKLDALFLRTIFDNCHVISFDFPAHGELVDDRQICTFGRNEAYTVIGAVDFIKSDQEFKDMPIIAYGFSMGAVASLRAQALSQIDDKSLFAALILDCPYDRSDNVIKNALNKVKISIFGYTFSIPGISVLNSYIFSPYIQWFLKACLKTIANMDATQINTHIQPVSPEELIKNVTIPTFFIQCRNDDKIPLKAVKKVYKGAQGFKRLWITNGRRHFDSFFYNPEAYVYKINKFITSILSETFKKKLPAKIKEDVMN